MFGIDVRTARVVWTAALVLLGLYCIYTMRTTLLVMLFGVFFSYLVYPLFTLAQRACGLRVPRTLVLLVVFAAVASLIGLVGLLFGNQIVVEATNLGQQLPKLLQPGELERRLPLPAPLEPLRVRLGILLQHLLEGGTAQALPMVRGLGTSLFHAAGNLIYVVVVPIFSFLMILEAPWIESFLASLAQRPDGRLWSNVARGLNDVLSQYVRALALLVLATLVSYSVVLGLLGVPFTLLLAGLAAVLEIIPVFGPLIAALTIVAVAAFSGYGHVWWLVLFFAGYRIFQDYILNPWLMSEGVNVPAILVVFGLLAGDELAGVPGIFLSVPVIAALRMFAVQVRLHRAASVNTGATPHR